MRVALLALAMLLVTPAFADVGLPILCTDLAAEGDTVNSRTCAASDQRYDYPQGSHLVRVDSAAVLGAGPDWTRSTFVWKRWDQLAPGELHETCTTDIPPGTPSAPAGVCVGWAFAAKGGSYSNMLRLENPGLSTYVLEGLSAGMVEVVLTAFNTAELESAASNPAVCTVTSTPGSCTLTWVPPTMNTDGSPLTNLAGYTVYWGAAGTLPEPEPDPDPEPEPEPPVVEPEPVPEPERGVLTITATLEGGTVYRCEDEQGAVISSHTTQHKAQESCSNAAMRAPAEPFYVVSGGRLRIVAE